MGLRFNGTNITGSNFNETKLTQINFNGTPIWYALQSCTISGNAEVGAVLTASVVPSSVQDSCTYQWYRASSSGGAGTAISGATSRQYTLTSSDRTYYFYCVATIGSASAKSNYTSVVKGWRSWSETKSNQATSYYPDDLWNSYVIPSNVKVTSIKINSWIENHAPQSGEARAENRIYLNGSLIKTGSKFGGSGYGRYDSEATIYSGTITSGTIKGGLQQFSPTGWHCGTTMTLNGQIFD